MDNDLRVGYGPPAGKEIVFPFPILTKQDPPPGIPLPGVPPRLYARARI